MKYEDVGNGLRRGMGALAWAFLVAQLTACLQMESSACSNELTCPSDMKCAANEAVCISTSCGDGVLDSNLGEVCDDGNIQDGDGCTQNCRSTEACGNGKVDEEAGEVCDDGNTLSNDGCSADCHSKEECGNGIPDAPKEACDDGNKLSGDGCSADCKSTELCGNKIVDVAVGEVCDLGSNNNGEGCSSDCKSLGGCGNKFRDDDEECDDGNGIDTDNCVKIGNKCLLARCGDGFIDGEEPGTEQCDGRGESAACNVNCTTSRCGDGIVNVTAKEQCDTRGQSATCNSGCTLARCGDGIPNSDAGEECDDGNTNPTDGCSNSCKTNLCGDGIRQDGEACDDGNVRACGTCSANCQIYRLAAARGSITAIESKHITDGETFVLDDGIHPSRTFEFDKNVSVTSGSITVFILKGPADNRVDMNANEVANVIRSAVNNAGALDMLAEENDSSPRVPLKNTTSDPKAGSFGNQRIGETVNNSVFVVEHMAGGGGNDCPAGTRCMYGEDCASGNCSLTSQGFTCQ